MIAIPIDHRTFDLLTELNDGVRPPYILGEDHVFIYYDQKTKPTVVSYDEFVENYPYVKTFKIGFL